MAYVLLCEPIDGVSARQVILVDRGRSRARGKPDTAPLCKPRGQQVPLPVVGRLGSYEYQATYHLTDTM